MIVKSAQFITSIAAPGAYAKRGKEIEWKHPEICFAGRSNVGKSSFINMLTKRKGLARVSNTPGRTRLLNFILVDCAADKPLSFMLVDLPGYGYAAASKTVKEAFAPLIEDYFAASGALKFTFVLLDIRHPPSADDMRMLDYLYRMQAPFAVIATKADKLSKAQAARALTALCGYTGLGRDDIIPVDHNGGGRERVLERIGEIIIRN